MAEKNYSISFKSSDYNTEFYQCKLVFKLADGVPLRDILEALRGANQTKLRKAWQAQGVQVFVKKGYMLGNVSEAQYDKYLELVEKQGAK